METARKLAKELAKNCKTFQDVQNALKDLFKTTLEEVLEAEMTDHLGYTKNSPEGDNSGNSRNGYSRKTFKTRQGEVEVEVPRDRNGEFEPRVVKKYERNASELEDQIVAIYAKGCPSGTLKATCVTSTGSRSPRFKSRALQATLDEYRLTIEEMEGRVQRLESEIHEHAEKSVHTPVIKALEAFRGIKETAAVTIVAEVGKFSRFEKAPQVMGYSGTVPSEYSSGARTHRGRITKAGNNHLRRILIKCAWSYRHKAWMSEAIRKRQEGQPARVQAISWKAQVRLCKKYQHLISKGKSPQVAVTAVARELLGFIWAAACEVEKQEIRQDGAA
ncbi:MAG: transposase [Firmicutes bacterium]|nr:transposase [Bacillota bacterium]